MLVSAYNKKGLKDVLVIMLAQTEPNKQESESKGQITQVKNEETNEVVGYNFFGISEELSGLENGPVVLTEKQVGTLNALLEKVGFEVLLTADESPKFVVGEVKKCEPVKDSDHLNLTETLVDNGEKLQIVCGASNIAAGQKVVVAKVGAIMPDGMVIWPGELKGIKSYGMVCSAKELGVAEGSETKGILVLPEDSVVGSVFQG